MAVEGAGGTPGGVGTFLLGLCMAVAGGYLVTQQVTVHTGFWAFWGGHTFGLTLVPLLIGVALLFVDGKSKAGWLLTIAGAVMILAGILLNLQIYFEPTSLFNTLLMLILLFAGLGLIVKSLKSAKA